MFQPDKFSELLDAPVSRPDPKSIQGLIAWLETQDGARTYCYSSNGHCLIAKYFNFAGIPFRGIGGFAYSTYDSGHDFPLPPHFGDVACGTEGVPEHTFGAALLRARACAASQVQS